MKKVTGLHLYCFCAIILNFFVVNEVYAQGTNVALGRPTTASSPPVGSLTQSSRAVDGNLDYGYRWQTSPASYDADGNVIQWMTVDLGSRFSISEATIITGTNDMASIFKIQLSDDGITWPIEFASVTGNTSPNAKVTGSGTARHVRLELIRPRYNWNNVYAIVEFQVIGTVPPANQSPQTSITSPLNNAAFTTGSNILINANATDPDGAITKVEFYQGGLYQ